jgi:hypothetical protein
MHVGEELPIFFRAAPGKPATDGMASHACGLHSRTRDRFVLDAMLRHVHHGLGFFGGEAMIGAEVFHN